jgi:hypothetical protein
MFTGMRAPWHLEDFQVFGCPVFELDKQLQDGDSLSKWKKRSWTGVYMGHSMQHVGNVLFVYNPITMHVTPQHHIVFDAQFTTVCSGVTSLPESYYETLFKAASSLPTDSLGLSDDLHLFKTFWADPP